MALLRYSAALHMHQRGTVASPHVSTQQPSPLETPSLDSAPKDACIKFILHANWPKKV